MASVNVSSDFSSISTAIPALNSTRNEAKLPRTSTKRSSLEALPMLPFVKSTAVWGIDFSAVSMEETLDYIDSVVALRKPSYAVTANLNYLMLCEKLPRLTAFTQKAALVLCDGMPILWRGWLNSQRLSQRVAGSDLIYRLAARCAERGHRLFLMGGAEGVALATAKKLCDLYPKLVVVGIECPPFRPLSENEHQQLCQRVQASKADVLLVAFGQPKGEFWIEENYQSLGVPFSIQLGASFDFIAGTAQRAPRWLQLAGLEWFYRMLHDPKRLIPRYAQNAWFLLKQIRRELLNATK
jgi:N-acetylglucosaminyldiphosphoundecaprenol N-acetyl-beta-D-mannosaminyltransferase